MRQKKQTSTEVKTQSKVMSREDILAKVAGKPDMVVPIEGWDSSVTMQNIDFETLVQMRTECPEEDSYKAGVVAMACKELTLQDVSHLQRSNGFQFAILWGAVAKFLGLSSFGEDEIKN